MLLQSATTAFVLEDALIDPLMANTKTFCQLEPVSDFSVLHFSRSRDD